MSIVFDILQDCELMSTIDVSNAVYFLSTSHIGSVIALVPIEAWRRVLHHLGCQATCYKVHPGAYAIVIWRQFSLWVEVF